MSGIKYASRVLFETGYEINGKSRTAPPSRVFTYHYPLNFLSYAHRILSIYIGKLNQAGWNVGTLAAHYHIPKQVTN